MRANLPDKSFFPGKPVPTRPDVKIVALVDSGFDGHLYRAHSAQLGRDLACKVIPSANLHVGSGGEETWKAEVLKADLLRNPAVVKFEDIRAWKDDAAGIDCVVLVSEFVEGPNLRKFIADHPQELTVPFIVQFLGTMLELFHEMKQRNVTHGDLHSGNILVEDRSAYALMSPTFAFRVTDFGVAEATSEPRFKEDFLQLADILAQLLRGVDYQAWGPKEKFVFNVLRNDFLGRHLVETDPTRDPLAKQPEKLFRRLQELDAEFENAAAQESARLLTPFDFLSCEQIGDAPSLLKALYSDRFLGLQEIESRNNIVVTGPRGCGKSTVFRSLSLRQKMRTGEATAEKVNYLGVYYRCDDLYFAFPRYNLPARPEALDIPLHFITSTLLAELLDSLEVWAKQHARADFVRLESRAAQAVWDVLGLPPPHEPGADTLKSIAAELQNQRRKAVDRQRFASDLKRAVGRCFGAEVLQRVCEALVGTFSFLRDRPFYFFIDDYSAPKVTKELQSNLNRLFMQRTSVCFFKLSTESPVSFVKSDVDQKIYVENREYILQNLGLIYLHAEPEPKLAFVQDIFRRRLSETSGGYPVKELDELIGSNPSQNNNQEARQIRAGEKPSLWGKETLCKLCSGDIHYLISLVGDMVKLAGGPTELAKSEAVPRVSQRLQTQAMREAAGKFLKNLRGVPKCGDKLVAIVEAFGNVAHSHLKHADSQNENGTPPKQATRIEPYEPLSLSDEAQSLYDELLRYSVFIEDFRGKSRRGKVVPRLFMRRFLIPHFNLTFSTRDSIELEPRDFEQFLTEPTRFEERFRLKTHQQKFEL